LSKLYAGSIAVPLRALVPIKPCLGIGILFTEISDLDQEYLGEPSVVALPVNLSAREVIEALASLFATQSFVTRDEFLYTIEQFTK
jgi:hypothetical protein